MTMRDERSSISDFLHHQFVDREAELAQLVVAVTGPIPLGTLVLVGPPGVGKSALLREFARCCSELAIPCALVDLTDEIGPDLVALRAAEHLGSAERTLQGLFAEPGRRVLLLDNYRAGSMLDAALPAALLAGSGETLVVMAMREAPPTSWFRDPGWSALLRVLPLENLPHAAAVRFLTGTGVEQSAADRLAELTAGHPLSLELLLQSKQAPHSAPHPDVPLEISERVLEFAFGELASVQRTAFEITALAGVSSEGTLRTILGHGDAGTLFRWLCTQPTIAVTPYGAVVREPFGSFLIESLAWRDPERLDEYREALRRASVETLRRSAGSLRFPHFLRLLALTDSDGRFRRALVSGLVAGLHGGAFERDEVESALALVPTGPLQESLRCWFARGLTLSRMIRDARGQPLAWTTSIPLDPSLWGRVPDGNGFLAALQSAARVREGERATLHLTWLVSPVPAEEVERVHALALATHLECASLWPQLALSVFLCDPETVLQTTCWDVLRAHRVVVEFAGRSFVLGIRDWRHRELLQWFLRPNDAIVENEPTFSNESLDRPAFVAAVYRALRDMSRPERLRGNPLLAARLVASRVPLGAGERQRIEVLRKVLEHAIAELGLRPQYRRWQQVGESAYLRPTESLERMAERLGIPFSTYRRYLKAATEWIAEYLWQLEVSDQEWIVLATSHAVNACAETTP